MGEQRVARSSESPHTSDSLLYSLAMQGSGRGREWGKLWTGGGAARIQMTRREAVVAEDLREGNTAETLSS